MKFQNSIYLTILTILLSTPVSHGAPVHYQNLGSIQLHSDQQRETYTPFSWLDQISRLSPFQIGNRISNGKKFNYNFFYEEVIPDSSSQIVVTDGIRSTIQSTEQNFDLWLEEQKDISFRGILSNIGGAGIKSNEVANGAVIASPSKERPNYFYQWVRDAAITINSLVEYLQDHDFQDSSYDLVHVIESYIYNCYKLQRLDNLSGSWKSLDGLGEPKFMADSTIFDSNWGRPQRDGPGLRVITIINYLNLLKNHHSKLSNPNLPNEKFVYEKIIKPDLKYIIKNWYSTGFDLWEEIDSLHLFTSLTQLKALKSGMEISNRLLDKEFNKELTITFNAVRFFILFDSGFKVSDVPYLIETPSLVAQGKRSGLDIASVLASLRSHDLDVEDDSSIIPFPISESSVFSTLVTLINDMKYRYPINHGRLGFKTGFALGRYPEDLYDGYGISEGNPWFISTATASELIYKIVYNLYNRKTDLIIKREHASIFSSITTLKFSSSSTEEIIIPFGTPAFHETTYSLINYADTFLQIIKEHVDAEGHMSEQFNKYSGYMEGAEDLTWSYGSFWSSLRWRQRAINVLGGENTQL